MNDLMILDPICLSLQRVIRMSTLLFTQQDTGGPLPGRFTNGIVSLLAIDLGWAITFPGMFVLLTGQTH